MTAAVAERVTADGSLMSRVLPGSTQTIGQMLQQQLANGQDNFVNPSSALYDVNGVLFPLLRVLVLVAAIGATMNVIPFFFYDLTEQKQKSYVRVLKVRAVFEDYGNKALKDKDIVEMIDLVNTPAKWPLPRPKSWINPHTRAFLIRLPARKPKRRTAPMWSSMRKSRSLSS